jgi:hypothetical protein
MSQEDMRKFLNEYVLPGQVTFFVHEYYPFLETTPHEICPHPLITDLLSWEEDLKRLVNQFKNRPLGIRTHSCLSSHIIELSFKKIGYKYVSNAEALFQRGLEPYRRAWGMWELPIYYMDNLDFWMVPNWPELAHIPFKRNIIEEAMTDEALYVFDFHPLHIVLNTRNCNDYNTVKKEIIKGETSPFELRFEGRGVGVLFTELCSEMITRNQRSYTCSEALKHFGCLD